MDADFLERLLATFRVEADEHVRGITAGLISLEKDPPGDERAGLVESVFREAHSLKGAARAVGLADVEAVCQALEDLFAGVKAGDLALTRERFDVAHRAVDVAAELVAGAVDAPGAVTGVVDDLRRVAGPGRDEAAGAAHAGEPETPPREADPPVVAPPAADAPESAAAAPRAGGVPQGEPAPATPEPAPAAPGAASVPRRPSGAQDTVRISSEKLEQLLAQTEELLTLRLMAGRTLEQVRAVGDVTAEWDKRWTALLPLLRELRRRGDRQGPAGRERRRDDPQAARLLDFAESLGDELRELETLVADLDRTAERNLASSNLLVEGLAEDVKKLLMLPFATVLEALPKLVRDLARDQGKDVDLSVSGEAIEVDRRILEELRVVFTHLLRNAVDHGIEGPEERAARGKPARGSICIHVHRGESSTVEVVVTDDGAGVDLEALARAADGRGAPAADPSRPADELLALAFQSGVSTSAVITDLSGRGLGLAIVREKLEKLGGRVALESVPGEGTVFRLTFPLTLATFRGVLVSAAGEQFVIPAGGVERVTRVDLREAATVQDRPVLELDGVTLPLRALADVLELPGDSSVPGVSPVLVVAADAGRFGCAVDEIGGEQEVIIKSLRPPLRRVRNVAAATILGSGRVVPVLDASDLVRSALRLRGAAVRPAAAEAVKRTVLVAEDSITSRMLLKSILEAAGYEVITAVDGVDAVSHLKTDHVDAVVSDVDMPRMNGFSLTEAIRADERLKELPVVLVTSLASREDRERGVDAGASAYIVKSSFDQGNLLDTLSRLVGG